VTHKISYKLGDLAKLINAKLEGDDQCEIHGLGTLANASQGQLSFLSNSAYIDQLKDSRASAIIVEARFADACPANCLVSDQPYVSYALASRLFDTAALDKSGVHPSACIAEGVKIPETSYVGPNVVIEAGAVIGAHVVIEANSILGEGVRIGDHSRIQAGVMLYHNVKLGQRVIIHSGAVIGADGFGFAFDGTRSIKIHQLGGVTIGDDVEIGAGSTIDRGAIDDTIIEQGVKIDNQVQIGHNCIIGEHTVICGCTAIAGSVTIGKYCIMGGASGAVGHITIADKVQVSAMSLVSKSIDKPGMYSSGTGHMKTTDWKRNIVRFQQLDDIAKRLKKIENSTDKD